MIRKFKINFYFTQRDVNVDLLLIVYYLFRQLKKIQTLFLLQKTD